MKLVQEIANFEKEEKEEENSEIIEKSNSDKNNLSAGLSSSKNQKVMMAKYKHVSSADRYSIFFLGKQITDIFVGQEKVVQSNMEN